MARVFFSASPSLNGVENLGPFHQQLRTPDEAKQAVLRYAAQGYDLIKVYDGVSAPVFAALVAQARASKIPVAGHVPPAVPFSEVLAAYTSIEHVEELLQSVWKQGDDAALHKMVAQIQQSGVTVVPSLQIYHRLTTVCGKGEAALANFPLDEINPLMLRLASGGLKSWSRAGPKSCARLLADEQRLMRITQALHQAGVPLALGSDSGPHLTLSGRSVLDELQLLVTAGLSREAALASATVQAAKVLGQADLGQIAPGFLADAVLLDADPRLNLLTLAKPHAVLARGVWFDSKAREALLQRAKQHADGLLTAGRLLEAI